MIDPCSPEARDIVAAFLSPYEHLALGDERDALKVDWEGRKIIFPCAYAVMNEPLNLGAALHEIGHFLDLPTRRSTHGLKFGSGVPLLASHCLDFGEPYPYSAYTEGRALGWQVLLEKELFGAEPDFTDSARALQFASDFTFYEGGTDDEKIAWAASLVADFYHGLDGIDAAKALLARKNLEVPREMDRQIAIRESVSSDWKPVSCETFGDWTIELFALELDQFDGSYNLSCSNGMTDGYYEFSSLAAAQRFRDRILEVNGLEVTASPGMSG